MKRSYKTILRVFLCQKFAGGLTIFHFLGYLQGGQRQQPIFESPSCYFYQALLSLLLPLIFLLWHLVLYLWAYFVHLKQFPLLVWLLVLLVSLLHLQPVKAQKITFKWQFSEQSKRTTFDQKISEITSMIQDRLIQGVTQLLKYDFPYCGNSI